MYQYKDNINADKSYLLTEVELIFNQMTGPLLTLTFAAFKNIYDVVRTQAEQNSLTCFILIPYTNTQVMLIMCKHMHIST